MMSIKISFQKKVIFLFFHFRNKLNKPIKPNPSPYPHPKPKLNPKKVTKREDAIYAYMKLNYVEIKCKKLKLHDTICREIKICIDTKFF